MMPKTMTITSRELDQDTARAQKAAASGPVVITDRGRPSHVLLSYEHYRQLFGTSGSIVERLAMPEAAGLELEWPRVRFVARLAKFG